MAFELSALSGIGDALFDVLFGTIERARPRLRGVAAWLAEAAYPPHGVQFVADDGAEYTGVVVIERNRPVLMLAARVCAARSPPRAAPALRPEPYARPLWSSYDEDGPIR